MMLCTQCGTEAAPEAKFCGNCGAALVGLAVVPELEPPSKVSTGDQANASTNTHAAGTCPSGGSRLLINKTIVVSCAIVAVAVLAAYYLHLKHNRFQAVSGGSTIAYEIDRKTGRSWMLSPGSKEFLEDKRSVETNAGPGTDTEKAILLVKGANTLAAKWGLPSYTSNESAIQGMLERATGELQIIGWKASGVGSRKYLVSHTVDRGKGPAGYFFEVDLNAGLVRNIIGDEALEAKYGFTRSQ